MQAPHWRTGSAGGCAQCGYGTSPCRAWCTNIGSCGPAVTVMAAANANQLQRLGTRLARGTPPFPSPLRSGRDHVRWITGRDTAQQGEGQRRKEGTTGIRAPTNKLTRGGTPLAKETTAQQASTVAPQLHTRRTTAGDDASPAESLLLPTAVPSGDALGTQVAATHASTCRARGQSDIHYDSQTE
jgi:hypothetical protein